MFKPIVRIALALAVPALAALALSPSGATANTRKSVAVGAACAFDGDNDFGFHDAGAGLYLRSSLTTPPEEMNNPQGAANCSITRDLPLSTDGFSDIELRFRSYRNTTPRDVTCVLYSLRAEGSILDSAQKTVVVPAFNPNVAQPLTVMDFAGALDNSANKGYAFARCFMPYDVAWTAMYSSEEDNVSGN